MVLQDTQYTQKAGWGIEGKLGSVWGHSSKSKVRWGGCCCSLQRRRSQGSLSVMKPTRNTKNPTQNVQPLENNLIQATILTSAGLTHSFLVITSQENIFKKVCESPNCLLTNPSHTQLQHFQSLSAHKVLQWRGNAREAAPVLHWTHTKAVFLSDSTVVTIINTWGNKSNKHHTQKHHVQNCVFAVQLSLQNGRRIKW